MKKSVCLMAILGAFAASGAMAAVTANDQSVEITFTGMVSESTCQINLIGGGRTLDLGTLKKAGGTWQNTDRGSLVPIVFDITNCDKNGVSKVALDKDILGQNIDKSDVANGTLATTQKSLNVQIYKDLAGNNKGVDDKAKVTFTGKDGQKVGKLMAGYAALQHNGDSTAVQAGQTVTAKGMFVLTFN